MNTSSYHKLLHRIGTRHTIRRSTLQLAGKSVDWYVPCDVDQVVEQAARQELRLAENSASHIRRDEADPFWATNWASGFALEQQLDRILSRVNKDETILELGCGSGVVSAGVSLRGNRTLATDYSSSALLLAQLNAMSNALPVQFRRLDWHYPWRLKRRFSVILGADITYARENFEALENCIRQLLTEGGCVVLAEPYRSTGEEFVEFALRKGWRLRIEDLKPSLDGRAKVRLLHLNRIS